ncbi:DUF805 domain-containing protein [Bradyrhizobium genosp. P]|uniref:DUF805 domain-containing protein n=1 Tax=Bradyrhizobium genosp. P TaxID=83641 RepID=UPI003CF62CC9
MLGYLFGFNARIGRLQFFLATIALAVLMTALCFVIANQVYQNARYGVPLTLDQMGWPILGVGAIFIVGTFMLQCMRIRDIGWDPVVIIVGWIAFTIVDGLIAGKFPALAVGARHQTTAVGAFVNLGLMLVLYFWPSGYAADEAPSLPHDARGGSDGFQRKPSAPAAATSRIARVANGEFGGRTR